MLYLSILCRNSKIAYLPIENEKKKIVINFVIF